MSYGTKSVLVNAIPLLALAAGYLAVTATVLPTLWRERRRARLSDFAQAAIFPCIGLPAVALAVQVLADRRPVGAHLWASFAVIVVALVPAVLFALSWRERTLVAIGGLRARAAEERESARDSELESLTRIVGALAGATEPDNVARIFLDGVASLFDVGFASLALVSDDGKSASGLLGRESGRDIEWWPEVRLDLQDEPSGIASAVFEAAPVSVYDVQDSPRVNRRVARQAGVKSAVYVPLVSDSRVLGVLVVATTGDQRVFTPEEIALMRGLAAEGALALERSRSAEALGEALERERLIARVATRVRSETDVAALLRVAVAETSVALGLSRCFVGLAEPGGAGLAIDAQWHAPHLEPLAVGDVHRLLVSQLAAQTLETVAVEDVASDPRLAEPELLLGLGTGSGLATPIVVFDSLIGVLTLHRASPGPWGSQEVTVAEAISRELGVAIHNARLLEENALRLAQRGALLKAAQVLTSELETGAVLQLLVDQVAGVLGGDAADCYLYDAAHETLRCAAVRGLDKDLVGFEFPADRGAAGEAIRTGRPVRTSEYELIDPVPHASYDGFRDVIVAPVISSGETRGVLGVGARAVDTFAPADADLLETYARLAALALHNAETFEQRDRQARIQRGFFRVASVLGEPLSRRATVEAVAQAAAEALGGAFAAVLMPGAAGLELAGGHGLPAALGGLLGDDFVRAAAAIRDCATEGRILAAPRLAGDDRFDAGWRSAAPGAGAAALLSIPVDAPRDEGRGLVVVFYADERPFTDDDLELAAHLARAARGALERSELFEAERTARSLAQQLARTGTLLATELDPAAVLDEVVQQAPDLLAGDAGVIRVPDGDDIVISAARGDGAEALVGSRTPVTGVLSGDVFQSRAPVAIANTGEDSRFAAEDAVVAAGYCAYVGVPLVGPEGAVHGVLSVYGRRPRTWRPEEMEALQALAANTSAALSNAELYQRVALEKERSFAILSNIADGIVAVDRAGGVVLWNAAAEQITGVPEDEAQGRTIEQVLGRTLDGGAEVEDAGTRLVSIRRSGEEIWLSLSEAVMRDPAGGVAGRIYAFRDISADRLVEEMKSTFVSAVSHELRTPLTSIYGFAETLLRQDILFGDAERRTFLGYIASESERLTAIVDQLLSAARLDTGDLQVNLAPTDVRPVLSEVVSTAEATGGENGHRFVVEVPEEPLDAEADRDKLRQVLANLVDNAVKYSPTGGTVTVSARRKNDTVEVEVVDEGIGIPLGEQQRIFRKFYRAVGGAPGGGTGLGLFIAQGLVTAMGGRIWVTSQEGSGSSFAFELPLARATATTGA